MDATEVSAAGLSQKGPNVLINASGPYQSARLSAGTRMHRRRRALHRSCGCARLRYRDRHAGRGGQAGRRAGRQRRQHGAGAVGGGSRRAMSSSSPGWSACRIVISPGNSFDPGLATTQSILGTLGSPVRGAGRWQDGRRSTAGRDCSGAISRASAGDGSAPAIRPTSSSSRGDIRACAACRFSRRSRSAPFTWVCGACPGSCAPACCDGPSGWLRRCWPSSVRCGFLGSDVGGMAVTLEGRGPSGGRKRIEWRLIARRGHGPYIPAMPSVILAKRLLAGTLAARGAMPCLGLFTLDEFHGRGGRPRHRGARRMSVALYRRLLGAAFDALPARVRELHDLRPSERVGGRAKVERGRSLGRPLRRSSVIAAAGGGRSAAAGDLCRRRRQGDLGPAVRQGAVPLGPVRGRRAAPRARRHDHIRIRNGRVQRRPGA